MREEEGRMSLERWAMATSCEASFMGLKSVDFILKRCYRSDLK